MDSLKQVFVTAGITFVRHSCDYSKLYVCTNDVLKVFDVKNPEREPEVLDIIGKVTSFEVGELNGHQYGAVTSKSGVCEYYDLDSLKSMGKLLRSPLALADAVFTHGGSQVLCGGADGELKLVSLDSDTTIKSIKTNDQVTAIGYNNVGDLAAVSLANGDVAIYAYSTSEPAVKHVYPNKTEKHKFVDDEDDDDLDLDDAFGSHPPATKAAAGVCGCDWHPNGDLVAVPTKDREIEVYDRSDLSSVSFQFRGQSHEKGLVDLKWSPNGQYLASVGRDQKLIIWETKSHKSVKVLNLPEEACSLSWGRADGSFDIVVGTNSGHIAQFDSVVSDKESFKESERPIDDLDSEPESEVTGLFDEVPEDDFIVDDDGSGYVEKKRPMAAHQPAKHRKVVIDAPVQEPSFTVQPFSPGGTPWNGNRKYLTMNSTGYAWTVKQDGYNTITVSFFDKGLHNEYHFKDLYGFNVASITEDGILLASATKSRKSTIMYKSHDQQDTWLRSLLLRPGEFVSCVSLSKTAIYVSTSLGFVRKYSLFGRIERIEKTAPVVACVNSDKYLFTVTYNSGSLNFNVQDLDGKYFQRNEHLPIHLSGSAYSAYPLKGAFFSLDGDPCVVGHDDFLLVLTRWRDPLQASWIPILDTTEGVKKLSTGDNIKCWPLGLLKNNFNSIVTRGSEYPSFPLAMPLEIPIRLPITGEEDEEDPEEELVRCITLGELLNDAISNDDVVDETAQERLGEISVKYDAALLKQFGHSCNDGSISDALYLATKLRDERALHAASKIAERLQLIHLVNKITKLREARMEWGD
ncbi:hypothetical protein OGAPHI_004433 [Ogataea philodendri]|uniref:Minichromosome loss protein Mcl1 middle region domain-containing protein n=1 Tax=Ogataea philodendri TaxID=1378263 RepID=A0A9P8T5F0_9ASCO|nr:uncharacterized protein OGAPHI_004433 [Ogataea philodendri]KAH3666244.1 hypothetical protein OGAPHI_004433 [Ogataea philodendri]